MKPLPKSDYFSYRIEGVRLYRDDLERMLGILKEESFNLEIRDESALYDSLEDMQKNLGDSPKEWTIDAKKNSQDKSSERITISRQGSGVMQISGFGDVALRVAIPIRDISLNRQTSMAHFPVIQVFFVGSVAALLSLPFYYFYFIRVTGLICLLASVSCLFLFLYRSILYPKTILNYRHESGFFARNRNEIFKSVISAIIGALISRMPDILSRLASLHGN